MTNQPELHEVTIYQPHTHAGKKLTPGPDGIRINVTAAEREFLQQRGVLTPSPSAGQAMQPEVGEAIADSAPAGAATLGPTKTPRAAPLANRVTTEPK